MLEKVFKFRALFVVLSLAVFCLSAPAFADEPAYRTFDTPRFTLHFGDAKAKPQGPLVKNIAARAFEILDETFKELTRVFGREPRDKVILRFLSPQSFREQTGAPAWTSAMYYRGEVIIPLRDQGSIDFEDLRRTLRHEYTHSIVAEISKSRCPAWLDEGVAQFIEGEPNPLLGPALRKWIGENTAMPLEWLQNGFTNLNGDLVPAAYAQSLFATRSILNTNGFPAIVKYLEYLEQEKSDDEAFALAFQINKTSFEHKLTKQIRRWSISGKRHP